MSRKLVLSICALCAAFPTGPATPQAVPLAVDMPVEGVTAYDRAIPRPEDLLGYVVGSRHTEPSRATDYFFAVAESSDRVVVAEHGRTHEGRPLIHAVVSSPANQARMASIRADNRRLSDDPESVSSAELSAMPAIVLLGYSVHGNEASGTEAALLTLYHLAAGEGAEIEELLDRLVVIIDPMLNPDGRDRFVDWVNRNRGPVANSDSQDREHQERWPGGRGNHFWYDLNRDWLPARQPETRARLAMYHEWRPQLVADFHEMGGDGTYFFQPGVPSRTHPNTPAVNQDLTWRVAQYHARALDRLGQLYFSRETFDDFYYGKGSSYPDVNGAVGILFEQASSRGLEADTENGTLFYATTVRNQFATSLSTLAAAVDMRIDLLDMQRDFYLSSSRFARERRVGTFLVTLEGTGDRALELARLLGRHRIRVYEMREPVTVSGRHFDPGEALLVPSAQPQSRLLDAMMRRQTTFSDSLFYDVSAWSFPLALDVEVLEIDSDLPLGEEWADSRGGPEISLEPGDAALVVAWDGLASARFLQGLQECGLNARLMTRPTSVRTRDGSRSFPAGALVVPARQEGLSADSIRRAILDAAAGLRLDAVSSTSGLTPDGPDFGGPSSSVLHPPRVALLTGSGTSASRAGETWEFLSGYLGLRVSLLDVARLGSADLEGYDVIVFAGGMAPDSALSPLAAWVERGGRVIGTGSAVDDLVRAGLVGLVERPFNLDSLTEGASWGERREARGAHGVGGAILETELDATHPLAFGIGNLVPTLRDHSTFYDADPPTRVVGAYGLQPLLAGYVSQQRLETTSGSVAVAVERRGRGAVIAILDEPVFRGFWLGSARLLSNAVFLGAVL